MIIYHEGKEKKNYPVRNERERKKLTLIKIITLNDYIQVTIIR